MITEKGATPQEHVETMCELLDKLRSDTGGEEAHLLLKMITLCMLSS